MEKILKKVNEEIPHSLRAISIRLLNDLAEKLPVEVRKVEKVHTISLLYVMLTDRCNASCVYCFRDAKPKGENINKEILIKALLSCKEIAAEKMTVVFTGGEPTLYPYLYDVAEASRKLGFKNTLQTNGLLINRNNVNRLVQLFDSVMISLDSLDEDINDSLRGKKGYARRAINSINLLISSGLIPKISITLTRKNVESVDKVMKAFPIAKVKFTPMIESGRARNKLSLGFVPDTFLQEMLDASYSCELFTAENLPVPGLVNSICGAGTGILSISPTGDVFPCQMLHHANFLCGNITKDTLSNIYKNSETIKYFRQLTVDDIDNCKDCDIRYICAGGCLANGFWYREKFPARDSFCNYNKRIYLSAIDGHFKKNSLHGSKATVG